MPESREAETFPRNSGDRRWYQTTVSGRAPIHARTAASSAAFASRTACRRASEPKLKGDRSLSDRTIRIFPDQNSVKILPEFKKI